MFFVTINRALFLIQGKINDFSSLVLIILLQKALKLKNFKTATYNTVHCT